VDTDRDESAYPPAGDPPADERTGVDPRSAPPWTAPSPSAFRLAACFPPALRRAAAWLPAWGLLIGVTYAGLFRLAWRGFGEYQRVRLAPMAVLLAADLGFFGYRLLAGAVRSLRGRRDGRGINDEFDVSVSSFDPTAPAVTVLVLGLLKYSLLLSLPFGAWVWPADWREHLGWLFPAVIYRPLILMPLWGRWAMMLAVTIGRVADAGSPRLHRMAEGRGLPGVLGAWLACSGLTVVFFAATVEHVALAAILSLGMMLVAYGVSFGLARRAGGQTEATIGAAGLTVEIAFLAAYVPAARSIYWY